MARSLNKVSLIGNLARDPSLRTTNSGTSVCNFTIVTNRDYQDSQGERKEIPEFHNVVAWGTLAEICSKLLRQGNRTFVEGRLQSKKYTGKDGIERTATEVVISEMIALTRSDSDYNNSSYDQDDDDDFGDEVSSALL